MDTAVLQVPMPQPLKFKATQVSREYGFSSLQEIIRLFLTKLARRELTINIGESPVYLSSKKERQYLAMGEDFKKEKNIFRAKDIKELMHNLKE